MTQKIQIAGLTLAELTEVAAERGLPKYRAKQIFANLLKYKDFSEMTDLPKPLRESLSEVFDAKAAEIFKKFESADGTVKYLLKMRDGELVECVRMKQSYGDTLCVSCQSGCRMGCKFCASGLSGLKRNLTAAEILSEVLAVNADGGEGRNLTNLVMMGCGEPMDNYDNTVKFLRLVTAKEGFNVSPRNISVSTCGLADRVEAFIAEGIPVTMCFSMHSPFDEKRAQIMPVEKRFSIAQTLAAFDKYFEATKRRFVVEYTVIPGFNDGDADADELKKLLAGKVCHVNLIPLNRVEESGLPLAQVAHAEAFREKLAARRLSVTVRRSAGGDVEGACGQLRRKYTES